ncbi:MAG: arsenate reductase [Chloroflexi bacterium RBG_13_53_26]|nr:MAG: arsenate reductase [Chloroflexi bacterium RBG_13_53_26]
MKTVLFVCVHNSGRSQMAEAFFNHLAGGKAMAISAGTHPSDAVNPIVIEVMREMGIEISSNKPKHLTDEMLDTADRVVSMGCGVEGLCPAAFVETEDWQIEDPKDKSLEEVRRIRDEIRAKIVDLLARAGFCEPC